MKPLEIHFSGGLEFWLAMDVQDEKNRHGSLEALCGNLFINGKPVRNLRITEGTTSIRKHAFHGCRSLETIIIPDSVTSIGEGAFYGCKSLKTIYIPNNVTSIGENAFYGCDSLKTIIIPEGVISIAEGTFLGCDNLETISLPSSLTRIERAAFLYCKGLKQVELRCGVEYGDKVFAFCENLTEVIIQEGVEEIPSYAFEACKKLRTLDLPMSVSKVGKHAFAESGIKTLIIRNPNLSLKSTSCFVKCRNYMVYVPEGYNTSNIIPGHMCTLNDLDSAVKESLPAHPITTHEPLSGVVFAAIAGLKTYSNRVELKKLIESLGGSLSSRVSGKTNYLITDDPESNAKRIQEALEFGVVIISEKEFLKMVGRSNHFES